MKENITISISSGTIVRVLGWITVFAGLLYINEFVIALLVAVVLASSVEMPVRIFVAWGIPRSLAVTGIFLTLLILVAAVVLLFIPPIAGDIARFIKTLPALLQSIQIFGTDLGFKDLSSMLQKLSGDISQGQIITVLKNIFIGTGSFFATTSVLVGSIFNFLLTFVLAFYLALEENGVHKFLRLVVPKNREEYIAGLWDRSQKKIGKWVQGQLLLSCIVALLVYIPMLILGMPYATLLAILVFLGELVPMVGLTIATIPALLVAFAHGGLSLLGIVAIIYFIVSQLEGNVLYPKVMNKMVGVPSIIVLIALVIGAKFAGIWGMILAVPLAAIAMELINDMDKRKSHVE
jgi:predicted PurR-regulated permease PerM